MSRKIIVDKAGATSGGARRFLLELETYMDKASRPDVHLIGEERLSTSWLIKRELKGLGAERIALNNASFALPGCQRTVLLRNALHFANHEEFRALGYKPSDHMRRQIPVIRLLAHRADRIIVPCTAMWIYKAISHFFKLRTNQIASESNSSSKRIVSVYFEVSV